MIFKGRVLLTGLLTLTAAMAQMSSPALRTVYTFNGNDGRLPLTGLAFAKGADGGPVFYGTTFNGGDNNAGTVFSLTPPTTPGGGGTHTVLLSFNTRDGANPSASVVIGEDGTLYGTTSYGGVVYALTPPAIPGGAWSEKVLHRFTGSGRDGSDPDGALAIGSDGTIYGTTLYGGSGSVCGTSGCGTVFALTPPGTPDGAWTETILHSFGGAPYDGALPYGGVVLAGGILYGTTNYGGNGPCDAAGELGCGTVFSLTPPAAGGAEWKEAVLHNFAGGSDGAMPYRRVAVSDGVLYGTTRTGGEGPCLNPGEAIHGCGTVYSLTPRAGGEWVEKVLHVFMGSPGDGANPYAPLTVGSGGILYGTTYGGGNLTQCPDTMGCGTVFSLAPPTSGGDWTEQILYNFVGYTAGGANPNGGVALLDGMLYGTTEYGGDVEGRCAGSNPGGCGTIYSLKQ